MTVARPLWRLHRPVVTTSRRAVVVECCHAPARRRGYAAQATNLNRTTAVKDTGDQTSDASLKADTGKLAAHPFLPALNGDAASKKAKPIVRDATAMAAKLDPRPSTRRRWERAMVIKSITRRGRLSKTELIKRTEREHTSKSDMWQTSMKKLAPLARQIAGKNLREAMVQMQFSKKRMSKVILEHLKTAELEAIVQRGMGVDHPSKNNNDVSGLKARAGRINTLKKPVGQPAKSYQKTTPAAPPPRVEVFDAAAEAAEKAAEEAEAKREFAEKLKEQFGVDPSAMKGSPSADAEEAEAKNEETGEEEEREQVRGDYRRNDPRIHKRIVLKDGSKHTVWDPSDIYIAQAWVGKGTYGKRVITRARGRRNLHWLPQTSISVLLKEEATRIREADDREQRLAKKKVFQSLMNRPILGPQKPYYCW